MNSLPSGHADGVEPGPFRCPECGRQCSRSPTDPDLEYGHQRHEDNGTEPCSRRSDRVNPAEDGRAAADVATIGISGSDRDPDTGRFAPADDGEESEGMVG